jgi:hypothetical protein
LFFLLRAAYSSKKYLTTFTGSFATTVFGKTAVLSSPFQYRSPHLYEGDKQVGGDKRDRTVDLLLARQALSQLSYAPIMGNELVGPSGLEPPTSPLSGVRSNQLS